MEGTRTELQMIKMSEIQSQEVAWLWYPFIPYGKLWCLMYRCRPNQVKTSCAGIHALAKPIQDFSHLANAWLSTHNEESEYMVKFIAKFLAVVGAVICVLPIIIIVVGSFMGNA